MGAAMTGLRPIAELMFSDFFAVTWDMVVNQIAKTRYMTDGQVVAAARAPDRQRRRAALRRPAQPEHRELGDGDPGAQGRRAVEPGRHDGPAGGRDPRPGPGHRLRAQGAVRDEGRGPRRRARRPARAGRGSSARAPTRRSSRSRRWSRKALEAAERLAAEHGIDAEVIDLRSLVPLDTAADPRLGREDEPAVHGRGEPAAVRLGRGDRRRSSPTRASTASTRRSCGSRRRTSRCRRRPRSRTSRSRRSTGSSTTVKRRLDDAA